jgi:hypothetical protein
MFPRLYTQAHGKNMPVCCSKRCHAASRMEWLPTDLCR